MKVSRYILHYPESLYIWIVVDGTAYETEINLLPKY